MARRKKDAAVDLADRHQLTLGLIEGLVCPESKSQAFLRDTEAPSLRVRVTKAGAKSYVFEGKLNRATIRHTIGDVRAWAIPEARKEANRLRGLLDRGIDPREQERERQAAADEKSRQARLATVTVRDAWTTYVAERKPRWSDLHYRDHVRKASPGGVKSVRGTRGTGLTQPGPLNSLMTLPLSGLTAEVIEAWALREGAVRPTSARLAHRLLKAFLEWTAQQPHYASLVHATNPAKTTRAREALGKARVKSDVLQRGQLAAWFKHVTQLGNPVISAALQVMLLTGARPNEVLDLKWSDVNRRWSGLTIRDKVEGDREIPLTPYVENLITALPRANEWVFSSARYLAPHDGSPGGWQNTSKTGRISMPNRIHTDACRAAGIEDLTLHGLRRSFGSLTEWLEVPAGIVAQIMGHKPSATAERHYKVRPLELLAVHHVRIEAWILEQASVTFEKGRADLARAA